MTVTVTSVTQQPYRQIIQTPGHAIFADVTPDKGGQDTAPDPHQLLLGAWGACTNMTLQMYANRKGWPLDEVVVTLSETKAANTPSNKPLIEKNIQLRGNLTQDQVDTLKRVAEKCPVNQLIMKDKDVQSRMNLIH